MTKRSPLRNVFLNTESDIDRKFYNVSTQNVTALLVLQEMKKKNFYSNLDTKVVTDNEKNIPKHSKINFFEVENIIFQF